MLSEMLITLTMYCKTEFGKHVKLNISSLLYFKFIGVLNKNTIRTPSVSNEAQRSNNDIDPVTDPDPSSNIVCSDDDNDDA
ncbi:unnamed protein product [Rotaria socialis]|uniref:Uncharacterized protein n=1 Tax=Rotaria socialis TaxID=392032 RepID=A0A818HK90_9BILA|nr:unnamed protein product [Rotaria socialis]